MSNIDFHKVSDENLLILLMVKLREDQNIAIETRSMITSGPSNVIVITFQNALDFRQEVEFNLNEVLDIVYKKYEKYSPKDAFTYYDHESRHKWTASRDTSLNAKIKGDTINMRRRSLSMNHLVIELEMRDGL